MNVNLSISSLPLKNNCDGENIGFYVLPENRIDGYEQPNDDDGSCQEPGVHLKHAAVHFEAVGYDTAFVFDDTDDKHPQDTEQKYDTHTIDEGNFVDACRIGHREPDGI